MTVTTEAWLKQEGEITGLRILMGEVLTSSARLHEDPRRYLDDLAQDVLPKIAELHLPETDPDGVLAKACATLVANLIAGARARL